MPYDDERASFAPLRALATRGIVEDFRNQLAEPSWDPGIVNSMFVPFPTGGKPRKTLFAIDGSYVYEAISGSLPSTDIGLVSLGLVIIDLQRLSGMHRLPQSGSVDPKELRSTEQSVTFCSILPGRNARKKDGTPPRLWFRQLINEEIHEARIGGESFAETLHALLRSKRHVLVLGNNAKPKFQCRHLVLLENALTAPKSFI